MADTAKQAILARRRQFLAATMAALAGSGNVACRAAQGTTAAPAASHGAQQTLPSPSRSSASVATTSTTSVPADQDGDGVPDERDVCPEYAGVDSEDASEAGCPARPCLSIIEPQAIHIMPKIYFATRAARIRPPSQPVLDEVARVLEAHPELQVAIIGHTDGTEPESVALARARSVCDYLIERGVASAMLTVRAEGDRMPVASNRTEGGRERNRRVELVVDQPPAP